MKVNVYIKIGRKQGLLGWDGEQLTVGVDAPPVKGAANTKLIEIISEWLSVSKNKIDIIKGHTARYKTLEIDVNPETFNRLMENLPRLLKQVSLLDDV